MAVFADVLEIRNGKNQKAVENPEGKFPIYGSGGEMGRADDYLCEAQTVIVGRKGNINNPIFVEEPFWNVDTAFGLVADKDVLLPRYLYYFCRSFDFERLNKAVTIPSLTKADLLKIEIGLPSLETQGIIVERLLKVEAVIGAKKKLIQQFDVLVKSRFVEMFVDKGFPEVTIRDAVNASFWLMPATPEFIDGGEVPYITSKNIKNRTIDFDNVKYISHSAYKDISSKRPIESGDILVSMIGTLGQTAIVTGSKAFYGQNLYLLRLNETIVDTTYFCEFFNMDETQHLLLVKRNQSTQAYLKANHVEDLVLPLPPIEQQRLFSALVAQVDKSKAVVQKSIDKLELLKASLMQEYFG